MCRKRAPIRLRAWPRRVVSIFWPTPVRSRAIQGGGLTEPAMAMPEAVSMRGLDQTHDGTSSTVLVSEAIMPVMAWMIMS